MEATHFDRLTRSLTTYSSRRRLVGCLAATAFGLATFRIPGLTVAKKRRKSKKAKKLQLNEFRCVDVGKPCRGNDANCCSGICQGKKPKKGKKDNSRCVAHDTGGCQADQDVCLSLQEIPCGTNGNCLRTTGKASFCGDFENSACVACTKDADCETDFGAGAACVVCAVDCEETGNRVCFPAAV
jgi:hypothetical protein